MTLAEVKVLRDKYYDALTAEDATLMDHSIGDASYSNDSHRKNLQDAFTFWDNLYNLKSSAGARTRLNKKAV